MEHRHFVSTVVKNANKKQNYVRNQDKEYTKLYRGQITLFD